MTITRTNKPAILATLCLATLAVSIDATILNIALPTLVRELDASNRELQWIVDAYNLVFAALVLAAGSLGDRYGRRGALVGGLALFATASVLGSQSESVGQLVAARIVMGVGAAFVFPATLAIISNVFTDRTERAAAIGLWGATGGLGVALGPITGGWLLDHFWWGSGFLAMVPPGLAALVLAMRFVPSSRDPAIPPLDPGGLALSTISVAVLVWTIIEAPEAGWTSPTTLLGAVVAIGAGHAFVRHESDAEHPMLDVRLFRNPRFSAASVAVALAFFALFGFIFLITQYFQFVLGHGPGATGVRQLPVALAIVAGSVAGVRSAVRIGNNRTIGGGLTLMAVGFWWASRGDAATPYGEIVGQMLLVGVGIGLTSAPATEAIMGAVPAEQAGVGSAVNDATRELGGTLGVAVIGSVFASIYARSFDGLAIDGAKLERARSSIGAAIAAARDLDASDPALAARLAAIARDGFLDGLAAGCRVAALVALLGAVGAWRLIPARPVVAAEVLDATSTSTHPTGSR